MFLMYYMNPDGTRNESVKGETDLSEDEEWIFAEEGNRVFYYSIDGWIEVIIKNDELMQPRRTSEELPKYLQMLELTGALDREGS